MSISAPAQKIIPCAPDARHPSCNVCTKTFEPHQLIFRHEDCDHSRYHQKCLAKRCFFESGSPHSPCSPCREPGCTALISPRTKKAFAEAHVAKVQGIPVTEDFARASGGITSAIPQRANLAAVQQARNARESIIIIASQIQSQTLPQNRFSLSDIRKLAQEIQDLCDKVTVATRDAERSSESSNPMLQKFLEIGQKAQMLKEVRNLQELSPSIEVLMQAIRAL